LEISINRLVLAEENKIVIERQEVKKISESWEKMLFATVWSKEK
jgi:hypothetical protein